MKEAHFRKILVVNLGGIGDLLLSTPALRSIKNDLKPLSLSLLTVPRVYDLARTLGYIDRVYLLEKRASPAGIWRNISMLSRLRKERFDLAINMRTMATKRGAFIMKWLLWAIRPALKAGRDTNGRGGFFDIKIDEAMPGDKYEMDYDIDIAKALGARVTDRSLDIKADTESLKRVKGRMEDSGIKPGGLLIGMHMGGMPSRRWPAENYFEFMKKVSGKSDCKFLITGEGRDYNIMADLNKKTGLKIFDMTGGLDIKELTALISLCDLYVSNDTGPMHIAAALQTPLVAIFGPGNLARFDPRNISDKAAVLYKKADCAPCEKKRCRTRDCLQAISPREAVEAALSLLNLAAG